jgi:hypothetical protein
VGQVEHPLALHHQRLMLSEVLLKQLAFERKSATPR